ncbi:guanylate-binding 4 [Sigmodon hispidus]
MTPETYMSEPMCLIENNEEQLVANQEALRILSAITQPVVVVAIVGLYRTGKSYLMNKLAGKGKGFSVRSTVQSHTKGIWMWCVPHPQKPDHTLVLLDTEGLGDVEKINEKNDTQIFALAILLSSTIVYNTVNNIDQGAIDLLHNVTEVTDLLRTRNSSDLNETEEAADMSFFPDLVWTLRDFYLELETNGHAITPDEYLENSLKLKQGSDKRTQAFNLPRLCIQKFFPVKKCFVFDSPAERNKLSQLETLSSEELSPEFVQELSDFCSYIFTHSKIKTLPGGIQVNGTRKSLVLTYVNAINSGSLPCIENTVITLARRENSAAVQKASAHYDKQMSQRVKLPTETLQELLNLHRTFEREAMEIFRKHSFKDQDQCFQKELETLLNANKNEICKKNVEVSVDRCSNLLQVIFKPLEEEVEQGVYYKPGGHYLFLQRMKQLKAEYRDLRGKGTQAEEVLQKYLKAKDQLSNTILQTNKALRAQEIQRKAEQARAEAARAEAQRCYSGSPSVKHEHHEVQRCVSTARNKNSVYYPANECMYHDHSPNKSKTEQSSTTTLDQSPQRKARKKTQDEHKNGMARYPSMEAPICLVENENEELRVNPEAISILETITQPVVVVAIVGLYRTGKSYLMNRLAGRNHGFPLGSTVQSQTKGIWMWCVPHPTKPNHTLVLLDTEGLGDVEKGDPKNDSWIFALAVLLSSIFVYNSMSTINHQALEQLHYVTELTQLIRAKSSPREVEDSREFVGFFPDFVWAVRDFMLELKLDGSPITADEYLENALKLIPGKNPKVQKCNMTRECIRYFFPVRRCFVFDRPTSDKNLLFQIEKIPENQLEWNFQVESKKFCSYIFSNAKTKTLRGGIIVTGNRLGTLVKTYVDAINSGTVPCLENAVMTLAQLENSAAVQRAAEHYSEQMAQRVRFPTDTLQELLDVHAACEKEAIAVFMKHSFKDDEQEFQRKLVVAIEEKKEAFMQQNEAASVSHCQAELEKLAEPLRASVFSGAFSVPGGHSLYLEARKKVEQGYERVPRKGVKAKEVFKNFLQSQTIVENSIMQSDKALENGQRALAAERTKKEVAEKERELLSQKQKEQEQVMEAQQRSFQENIAKLQEKMEQEREMLLREQEKMLEHKLKALLDTKGVAFEKKNMDVSSSHCSDFLKDVFLLWKKK